MLEAWHRRRKCQRSQRDDGFLARRRRRHRAADDDGAARCRQMPRRRRTRAISPPTPPWQHSRFSMMENAATKPMSPQALLLIWPFDAAISRMQMLHARRSCRPACKSLASSRGRAMMRAGDDIAAAVRSAEKKFRRPAVDWLSAMIRAMTPPPLPAIPRRHCGMYAHFTNFVEHDVTRR